MFSGVVFDLDGVIVDSHPLHKQAWRAFLGSVGKQVSESDLDFILEGRRRRDILIHFLGDISETEIQEYGNKKNEYFRQASSELEPVPGTIEFIRKVRETGLRIAVATSASRQRTRWTLEQLKIADCFEVVVTGDDVVQSKPDPAIYQLAAQRLSISPECLFAVEDSVCGVHSAKSAGLRCLGIGIEKDVYPLLQAGADLVFPSLVGLSISNLENIFDAQQCTGVSQRNRSHSNPRPD
ncbi:MAG TPA: HAD family phosphatase [Candidatus Acidoferrum sp.]|nr:HAD family phosphatase [Candidatus Acidoferrum sp.]